MKTLALALGGLAAAWMAAPTVSLAVHGTIDGRTRAAWRVKARATPLPAPLVVIPSPRRGEVGTRASA
ncbi:MAG TPA: hypothetical protein VNP37_08210 [Actinomycetospora sp.]|nr:hypothetical protein [Actinomycetospora sp.]